MIEQNFHPIPSIAAQRLEKEKIQGKGKDGDHIHREEWGGDPWSALGHRWCFGDDCKRALEFC